MSFTPFGNESDALAIGNDGLKIENRLDRVSIYGSVDLTKDQEGLRHGKALLSVLQATVAALEASKDLPENVEAPTASSKERDPFG